MTFSQIQPLAGSTNTEGAPPLRFLQGWVSLRLTPKDFFTGLFPI
jgi:hypothetical protein